MTRTVKMAGQLAILWGIYWVSNWFVAQTALPVPGNVLGVILLFTLLALGVIKVEQVREAADFLLKHLVFFFVPIAVGLMDWGGVFYDYGLILLLAIVISALLPFLAVGFLTQYMHREKKRCNT